jgi:hypothetical protein
MFSRLLPPRLDNQLIHQFIPSSKRELRGPQSPTAKQSLNEERH